MYYNSFYHLLLAFLISVTFIFLHEFETADPLPFIHYKQDKLEPNLKNSLYSFLNTQSLLSRNYLTSKKQLKNDFCIIKTFGYTTKQSQKFFPLKLYPQCENREIFKTNKSYSLSSEFELVCDGKVALGSSPEEEEFGNVEFKGNFSQGLKKFSLNTQEFFFAKCEDYIKPYYKLKEQESVKKRAQDIKNKIVQKVGNEFRPLAVHLVMFDSLSRLSFFRNFPGTVNGLNGLSEDLCVYDFYGAAAHGFDTQPNLIPIIFGHSSPEHWGKIRGLSIFSQDDRESYLKIQEKAIWSYFKKMGFVTMFGYDTVWDYFSYTIGRKISTDHVSSNFFHAAKKFTGYEDFKKDIQCIGNETSDYYLLKYFQDFASSYKGLNKFSYIHLSQGHERSGQVIRTVDVNLKRTLEDVIEGYKKDGQDFLILLAGDHGKHSREWDWSYEGIAENRLPLLIMIGSQSFFEKIGSKAHLNVGKLVSRLDLHLTLKHLAISPYGRLSKTSSLYKFWQNSIKFDAHSLLIEEIPNRSCNQLGFPNYLCPCEDFSPINHTSSPYIQTITRKAFSFQRSQLNAFNISGCKDLYLDKVLEVSQRKLKEDYLLTRFLQIHASVFSLNQSLVNIQVYFTSLNEYRKRGSKPDFELDYSGTQAAVKILNFTKIDNLPSCSDTLICYCN